MRHSSSRAVLALGLLIALIGCASVATSAGATARPPGAGPGSFDPTFGKAGQVFARTIEEVSPSEFTAAAREPNGDLVLEVQFRTLEREGVREVELRTPSGALVPSFGDDGRVAIEGNPTLGGAALATLSNGDIAVADNQCDGKPSSLEMLDPSGARVAGFGEGGCAPAIGFEVSYLGIDPQGRILLAGQRSFCEPCGHDPLTSTEAEVARLSADGHLDASFGKEGIVATRDLALDAGGFTDSVASGVGATRDGGVLLAADARLIRLEPDGTLDASYGEGGLATAKGGSTGLSVEPDGGAVLIRGAEFDKPGAVVTKLTAAGIPDPSFGEGGTTKLDLPAESPLNFIEHVPGGGYLIAGERAFKRNCTFCENTPFLERLTAAGKPDPRYGNEGIAVVHLPKPRIPWPATQRGLVVNPDGSAVVVGGNYEQDSSAGGWTATGASDGSFGKGGVLVEHHEQPAQLEPTGLALTPGGGLAVLNQRLTAPGLITGFRADFGADGRQLRAPDGAPAVETLVHGSIVPLGGRRLAVFVGNENRPATGLKSVAANGLPIPGFGKEGIAEFPPGFVAKQVSPAPGGGILAVGVVKGTGTKTKTMAVLRLGPGGHPVPGFGRAGLVEVPFPGSFGTAVAGLVEADGDAVVTGTAKGHVVAVRLLPDGRLDKSYGRGGSTVGLLAGAVGTLIAPWHGGVVIAASSGREAAGLIRLDRDGRLVRGFGRRGVVRRVPENAPLGLFTGEDRIVTVTDPVFEKGHEGNGVELRSYLPGGAVDHAFGKGGVRFFGSGGKAGGASRSFVPVAAVQQQGGGIVVAGPEVGGSSSSRRSKAELVRFLVR